MTPPRTSAFTHDVFLSHSATDKAVVRPLPVAASRQSAAVSSGEPTREEEDGGALSRRRCADKIEAGLEHPRVVPLAHRMGEGGRRPGEGCAANAFGSDWAQLRTHSQPSTFNSQPTTAPLNQERRFIPLWLDDASGKAVWTTSE